MTISSRLFEYENAKEIITNQNGLFIRDEKHRQIVDKHYKKLQQSKRIIKKLWRYYKWVVKNNPWKGE